MRRRAFFGLAAALQVVAVACLAADQIGLAASAAVTTTLFAGLACGHDLAMTRYHVHYGYKANDAVDEWVFGLSSFATKAEAARFVNDLYLKSADPGYRVIEGVSAYGPGCGDTVFARWTQAN